VIYVGTAGWSYPQGEGRWDGLFYPRDRRVDKLAYYASHFDAVEINSSFYRPLSPEYAATWARKTPSNFRFTAKLYQKFTHPRMYQEATGSEADLRRDDFDLFKAGLAPLVDAGKLGALLAQFPASFKADDEAFTHLEDLVRQFADYRLAVELRHRSWTDNTDAARLLAESGVAWCIIDEPKFRTSVGAVPLTGRLGYFRFHGRNAADWWHGDRETRYNYLYSAPEQSGLATEVQEVAAHADDTYVFYNNHYRAKAVVNATQLKAALGQPIQADFTDEMLTTYQELTSRGATVAGSPAPRAADGGS